MHLIPKFELNTDPNSKSISEKKKECSDLIERLIWNHAQEFKSEYGMPMAEAFICDPLNEEKIVRLFYEESL